MITFNSPIDIVDNSPTENPVDAYLTYSETTHRYVLTINAIASLTGDNAVDASGSTENANNELNRISIAVYTYMYSTGTANDKRVKEFVISRNSEYANTLQDAMIAMWTAGRISGAHRVYYQHGLDTGNSASELNAVRTPLIVRDLLDNDTLLARYPASLDVPVDLYRVGY